MNAAEIPRAVRATRCPDGRRRLGHKLSCWRGARRAGRPGHRNDLGPDIAADGIARETQLSTTDPLTEVTWTLNDAVGRPKTTTLADNRVLGQIFDPASNVTQVTLRSTNAHAFTFTPMDEVLTYTPPGVGSNPTTTYAYDPDGHLKTTTRPDGIVVTNGYDPAGRLHTTTIPQGTITWAFDPATSCRRRRPAAR